MFEIPEFKYDYCINCETVKRIRTEITLENCNVPIKTGPICENCYWVYMRDSRVSVIK